MATRRGLSGLSWLVQWSGGPTPAMAPAAGAGTGASKGVLSKFTQVPCKSGWPSGVF